jgi:hypothetical protein
VGGRERWRGVVELYCGAFWIRGRRGNMFCCVEYSSKKANPLLRDTPLNVN